MTALIGEAQTALSIRRRCQLLELPRATYYRQLNAQVVAQDLALRHRLQQLALERPAYGYRRITAALHREGWGVNHKRVLRLLRADNLLCLRKRSWLCTTDSRHGLPVYPNLAAQLTLTGLNQLWVADLTYIRLAAEFIYLAVLLDVYSRRCIGWRLGRELRAELPLAALRMALASREVTPGLVHHSDQGVQYASGDYTAQLADAGIRISMARRGNPYDNAYAESFIKTLKYEEVYLTEYENLREAEHSIGHFIEEVYNRRRLHSALDYRPPVEYEGLTHLN